MSSSERITADATVPREWRGMHNQIQRQRWESQWMAELGESSKVIEHDPREDAESAERQSGAANGSGGQAHDASASRRDDEKLAAQRANSDSTSAAPRGITMTGSERTESASAVRHHNEQIAFRRLSSPSAARHESSGAHGLAAFDQQSAAPSSAAYSGSAGESLPVGAHADIEPGAADSSLTARPSQAAGAAHGSQGVAPPKHFAIWRNDDTVRFALRTREPEKAHEIIGVLRGWLRAAGLSLRDVWINGRNHHGS